MRKGENTSMTPEKQQPDKPVQEYTIRKERTSQFQGAQRKKETMDAILQRAREELPKGMATHQFVCLISYEMGLSTRKIKEDYIDVMISVGILQTKGCLLELGGREKEA